MLHLTREFASSHHDYYEPHDGSDIFAFIVPGGYDSKYDRIVILPEDDYDEMKDRIFGLEVDLSDLTEKLDELKEML